MLHLQSTYCMRNLEQRKDELDHQMIELDNKSRAHAQEQRKLFFVYEQELKQWLDDFTKEKNAWKRKRESLSQRCAELDECIQTKWAATQKLKKEKEKYCKLIIELLPEWQEMVQTKQMKQIYEYESKMSMIQQRRRSADIAFEKEKRLFALLSIQQKEIHRLECEEKQDTLNREHQRNQMTQKNTTEPQPEALKVNESHSHLSLKWPEGQQLTQHHQSNSSEDDDDNDNHSIEADDTSQIEKAVGLIEMTHGQQQQADSRRFDESKIHSLNDFEEDAEPIVAARSASNNTSEDEFDF